MIQTESAINDKKQTSSSSYDANGTVILETDTLGVKTSYTYDSINRLISRTVAKNESITYTTDYSYGNVKVHDGIAEKTISNAWSYVKKKYKLNVPNFHVPAGQVSLQEPQQILPLLSDILLRTD